MLRSTRSWAFESRCVWLFLVLFLAACGADTTAIQQQILGQWEEQSYTYIAADGSAIAVSSEPITLTFLKDGTYVRLSHIGPSEERGIYHIIDESHLAIDIRQTSSNKEGPKETQEFHVDGSKLTIITSRTKGVYQRKP